MTGYLGIQGIQYTYTYLPFGKATFRCLENPHVFLVNIIKVVDIFHENPSKKNPSQMVPPKDRHQVEEDLLR